MQFRAENQKHAYTLVEMMVVIAILVILSAVTLGSLRASRGHQVLEQAAGNLELLLESAKAHAVTHGVSVLLVAPEPANSPGQMGFRALTLVRDEEGRFARIREWKVLPHGIALAPDPFLPDGDLLRSDPRQVAGISPEEGDGSVFPAGPYRVLVEVSPAGRFFTGPEALPRPGHLALARGEWFRDATGDWRFDNGGTVDAVRVHLRPLTGITQSERVEVP